MGFCSRLHITPVNREFHDDDDGSDLDPSVSDHSSDIEEESKLKQFTQALQMAQTAALKKANEKTRGPYLKKSRQTIKRHEQNRIRLAEKGTLSLYEYASLKGIPLTRKPKHDTLTPKLNKIALREESEESSDEANGLDLDSSINSVSVSEVESEQCLPSTAVPAPASVTSVSTAGSKFLFLGLVVQEGLCQLPI
jgi:hypothetical protein